MQLYKFILDLQDFYFGITRKIFWICKTFILELQEKYFGITRVFSDEPQIVRKTPIAKRIENRTFARSKNIAL